MQRTYKLFPCLSHIIICLFPSNARQNEKRKSNEAKWPNAFLAIYKNSTFIAKKSWDFRDLMTMNWDSLGSIVGQMANRQLCTFRFAEHELDFVFVVWLFFLSSLSYTILFFIFSSSDLWRLNKSNWIATKWNEKNAQCGNLYLAEYLLPVYWVYTENYF